MNLGLGDDVCKNMLNKALLGINCVELDESTPEALTYSSSTEAGGIFTNLTSAVESFSNQTDYLKQLTKDVCAAEVDTQVLLSAAYGIRGPISAIFPLIIVLFAGGWSDKKGLRF